jgi:uncharacterized protein HemY
MITKKICLLGEGMMYDHRTDHKQDSIDEIHYTLNKRIPTIYAVSTRYGDIYLDDEAIALVQQLLKKHYESELKKLVKRSTKPMP